MASLKREIVLPSRLMKSIVSSLKLVQTSDPGEKIGRKQKLAGSCWDDRYLQYFGLEMDNFLQMVVDYLSFEDDDDDDVFEGLVASESYSTFFTYMCSVRRRREWAERTMCSSRDSIDWSELMRQAIRRDLGDVTVGDDSDIECLE
ncbi:unnamed protein product [Durusdinium trenchii]|uniref:Uncharacterized protein n=1 Tax=Durusdinium trenchii TaxID=1381693 RepID=A0ABP0PGI5_9DINO